MKKIVITGGHITPALALIEELQKSREIEIIFFGRKYSTEGSKNFSAEYQIINKKNIKFYKIITGRLQRNFTKYTLISLLKIPIGFIQSFVLLLVEKPKLVVSFGGYISVPVVFASWLLSIDSITHEQASVPGLATIINSFFVKKIFLSWEKSKNFFSDQNNKTETIGNLIRNDIFNSKIKTKKIKMFIENSENLIYITGGNQGSHMLNNVVFGSIGKFKKYKIIHQLGTINYANDWQKAQKIKNNNYLPIPYIESEDLGAILRKAKIVVSRSGANISWELLSLSKPSILIPLTSSSGNEQYENAKELETAGIAKIIPQSNLSTTSLLKTVGEIEKKLPFSQKTKKITNDAAKKMANFITHRLK